MHLNAKTLSASLAVAVVAAVAFAMPATAKNPSAKKLMDMAARCAYVVGIAENSNVATQYGSAEWLSIIRQLEQATGLDSENYLEQAKAKYNRRARVMGADDAYKHMLSIAKVCDREMGVIMAP